MSVSIYVQNTAEIDALMQIVGYLKSHFYTAMSLTDIHLMHPYDESIIEYIATLNVADINERFNESSTSTVSDAEINVENHEAFIKKTLKNITSGNKKKLQIKKLPQNHMRNLARRSCLTPYSIVSDIDMLPVPGM